jgi:hypothetical protein
MGIGLFRIGFLFFFFLLLLSSSFFFFFLLLSSSFFFFLLLSSFFFFFILLLYSSSSSSCSFSSSFFFFFFLYYIYFFFFINVVGEKDGLMMVTSGFVWEAKTRRSKTTSTQPTSTLTWTSAINSTASSVVSVEMLHIMKVKNP